MHRPTPVERLLLMILGRNDDGPEATANVFLLEEFESLRQQGSLVRAIERQITDPESSTTKRRVGLTLSGGGSRAIAFHLGCLRALHDLGILPQVQVISTVSGGKWN